MISDHLGSTRLTLNNTGNILQRLDYQPFGSEINNAGDGARTSYIGREKDNESELGFYGVRLYEPEYGRFMSVDAMWGKYASMQPFQYAGNSPIIAMDDGGDTIVVQSSAGAESYTFDGFELVDKEGNSYSGDDRFLLGTASALRSLLTLGGSSAGDIKTMIMSDKTTTFVMGMNDESAANPDIFEGIDVGIEMATFLHIGVDAKVTLGANLFEKIDNDALSTVAHENRHAFHLVTGTREYNSERQGLLGENEARHKLGMPMRLTHGAYLYPWAQVVPYWVKKK